MDNGGLSITGYRIYRGEGNGSEEFLVSVGNVSSYTDAGLRVGATRDYRLSAVNASDESTLSGKAQSPGTAHGTTLL